MGTPVPTRIVGILMTPSIVGIPVPPTNIVGLPVVIFIVLITIHINITGIPVPTSIVGIPIATSFVGILIVSLIKCTILRYFVIVSVPRSFAGTTNFVVQSFLRMV